MRVRDYRLTVAAALAVAVARLAAAGGSGTGPAYTSGGRRIPLVLAADELSVGLAPGRELTMPGSLQTTAGAVRTVVSRLTAGVRRLRIDPLPSPPTAARLTDRRAPAPAPAKPSPAEGRARRLERQRLVMQRLAADPAVAWVYPAYRNPETGTLLWLTPGVIVGVRGRLGAGDVAARLPADLRLARVLGRRGQFLVEPRDPRTADPLAVAARLAEDETWVASAEPDFIEQWTATAIPDDPLFPDQWHLENTGQGGGVAGADARLSGAWDMETGNGTVRVAIIDDGVQTTHPDLPIFVNPGEIPGNGIDDDANGKVDDVNGWDFFAGDNDPNPVLTGSPSHGTAVAGVAAARGNNGVGVTGACRDCVLVPVRVADDASFASNATLADAITYAGSIADVLNNSWGGGSPSTAITSAIQGAAAGGRGGLGSPVLFANGNSASGYFRFTLSGFTAGTWTYHKDASGSAGSDTVWLDGVVFPDGSSEGFEGCVSLPSGWTSSGDAAWTPVDDGTRSSSARGGRCSIRAGVIGDSQTSSVSVTRTLAAGGDLVFRAWPSSETTAPGGEGAITSSCRDFFDLTVSDGVSTFGPFFETCGTWSNQGRPLEYGTITYPSSVPEAISVGAATNYDRRSDYSQWGPGIDFVCHSSGGSLGITTTDLTGSAGYDPSDDTSTFGGTSSATPLCSGIAALAISRNPALTGAEVRQLMRDGTRKIGSVAYVGGWNDQYGYGAVDASAVVAAASPATIIVEKQTIPDGDPATFTFTGDAAGTIGDDGQLVAAVGTGSFTSTETVPAGWSLFKIACDDSDSSGDVGSATASFAVAAGETVRCIFTDCSDTVGSVVELSGLTVSGAQTFEACDTLAADTVAVTGTGDARFRAGSRIILRNGFSVASGGTFAAAIAGSP